jgi:F-type H+-transporting ATPase subunit beta
VFVTLDNTVKGFAALLSGEGDLYPENAFYMVGDLEQAFKKG